MQASSLMHTAARFEGKSAVTISPTVSKAAETVPRASSTPQCQIIHVDNETSEASPVSRRSSLFAASGALIYTMAISALSAFPAEALGFKKELKKRKIPESDYVESEECGLRIYEVRGRGAASSSSPAVSAGDTVTVHFDVLYRGLDVASSRSARLLGANRTIAEPYSFVAGGSVRALTPKRAGESGGGGLFSGAGGPEPPPALSTTVLGMRVGGIRSALVPSEKGYGDKGLGEIPAGASFELRVEVLDVKKRDK